MSGDDSKILSAVLQKPDLSQYYQNHTDCVWIKNRKLQYIWTNPAFQKLFENEDLKNGIKFTDSKLYFPSTSKKLQLEDLMVLKGSLNEEMDRRCQLKGGKERILNFCRTPIRNKKGEIVGILGVIRNHTSFKRTEERLKALLDHLPDAIYFKDLESRFILLNKALARHLEVLKPEQAYGKSDFDFFSRKYAQLALEDEQRVIQTGIPIINKEEYETRPDGDKVWISTTKMPLRNKKGEIIGTFGLSRDIQQLKNVESDLQQVKIKLEKKVNRRTRELSIANRRLDLRLKQLGYLREKTQQLVQIINKNELLEITFEIFRDIFPDAEIQMLDYSVRGWRSIRHTSGIELNDQTGLLKFLGTEGIRKNFIIIKDWLSVARKVNPELASKMSDFPCAVEIFFRSENRLQGGANLLFKKNFIENLHEYEEVLKTLTSQVSIALDNANHYLELQEKTRLQSEIEVAQRIQRRFLPGEYEIPNFRLKGVCLPATEIGGDYLDYFKNDFGDWIVVVADVCGKGIPAALVMTSLRTLFRAEGRIQSSSKELLCKVNDIMGRDLQLDSSFITCLCLVLKSDGSHMNYARAGHPLMIKYNTITHLHPGFLPAQGIALGMVQGEPFRGIVEEIEMELNSGDILLAYSDGLNETMNPEMEPYGLNRLMNFLGSEQHRPPNMVDSILQELKRFARGQDQHDDLTLVAIEKI